MNNQEGHGQDQAYALEERLIQFAVRIIKLTSALPKTNAGNHIAGQILRSGTSPAPNYGEARGYAESHSDFLHKIRIVLKELNETHIWLRIIRGAELVKAEKLEGLTDENEQLCKIFMASVTTVRNRPKSRRDFISGKVRNSN